MKLKLEGGVNYIARKSGKEYWRYKGYNKKEGLVGSSTRGLIGATFGYFIGFAAVALYGPAAKHFNELLDLSGAMLGLLVAIPQLICIGGYYYLVL